MRRAALLISACAVVLVAGCGGGDDTTETVTETAASETTAPPTKAEYIVLGDEICEESQRATKDLQDKADAASAAGDYDEASAALEEGVALTRKFFDRFEAIPLPDEGAATMERYFDSVEEQLDLVENVAQALKDGDYSTVSAQTEEADKLDSETDGIAIGFGFKTCGQGDD